MQNNTSTKQTSFGTHTRLKSKGIW